MLALTTMTRLGLIVRLLVGAFVNTLIVLVLLASAVVVLLWIVGRNKQLRAKRQQRYVTGCAASGDHRCRSAPSVVDVWRSWSILLAVDAARRTYGGYIFSVLDTDSWPVRIFPSPASL